MRNRILLVDDEPANLVLLAEVLQPFGCELVCARDGVEALAALDAQPFDLVLLDRMMPRMDGIELLRRLRARADARWLPVILVTADADRDARLRGLEAGADEFLEKPVDRALLTARVRTLLRLRDAQEQLAERATALERLHRERRELVDFIVHDLKNPLAVVRMNLSYAQRSADAFSESVGSAILDAQFAADRMSRLVHNLLNVERLEQAGLELQRERLDLATLVTEVVRGHRREAEAQRLDLRVVLADGSVEADRDLLFRALENLVENALRHAREGGRVEVAIEHGDTVDVVVSNSGLPVPPAVRPSLFLKYARAEEAGGGRFGIGLYFCERVATAHGGTIALVDRPDWPVSFRLSLPRS